MKKYQKIVGIIFIIFSAIGFVDATYLTIQHYNGVIPPCTIDGCEIVLTSPQSVILGIPVALLGALYYVTILILAIAFIDTKNIRLLKGASYITILGFFMSLYFVYLQIFVIKNICQYCMVSALTSTVMFLSIIFLFYRIKKDKNNVLNIKE